MGPAGLSSAWPAACSVTTVSKTLLDLDEELLTRAQRILGTATKKATVNTALREVVRRHAAAEFVALATGGVFTDPDGGTPQ
jgi:Arc/MetJ family transcription regulator